MVVVSEGEWGEAFEPKIFVLTEVSLHCKVHLHGIVSGTYIA